MGSERRLFARSMADHKAIVETKRTVTPALRGIRVDSQLRAALRLLGLLTDRVRLLDHTGADRYSAPDLPGPLFGRQSVERATRSVFEKLVARGGSSSRAQGRFSPRVVQATVLIGSISYRIRGVQLRSALGSNRMGVLISIECFNCARQFALRAHGAVHLTRREAEVALLLADRLTNAEIAQTLGISAATARHHTERVLIKLGVQSRREVKRVLRETADAAADITEIRER